MSNNTPDNGFIFVEQTPGGEGKDKSQITYSQLLNGPEINALASFPTTFRRMSFTYTPTLGDRALFQPNDVKTTIPLDHLSGPVGTAILTFFYFLKKLTKQTPFDHKNIDFQDEKTRTILLDTEEFLKMRGRRITPSNKKEASKEIKSILSILSATKVDYTVPGEPRPTGGYHLLSADVEPGRYYKYFAILINYDLMKYLTRLNFIMNLPDPAFSIIEKEHPNAFSLVYFLSYYYGKNYHKKNKGKISLLSLLQHVSDIPSLEEIKGDRHAYRRIIEALERDLDYLRDEKKILKDYFWTNPKGEPLTDTQLENYNYETLSECILIYEMRDFPEVKWKELEAPKDTKKKKKTPQKE